MDAVYQAIRQAILTSRLKPGERLNVDDLAAKLGVSLTPIRGAIQQLATEGLIEIRPRSGTFVAQLTERDVEETFKIQCALECLAAEEAVGRLSELELDNLRESEDVHHQIVVASGNRKLQETYDTLSAHLSIARIRATDRGWTPGAARDVADHNQIVNAIASGDAALACSIIRRHAHASMKSLLAALRDDLGSAAGGEVKAENLAY